MDSLHDVLPRALAALLRAGPISQGKLELAWRAAVGGTLSRVSTVRLQADGSVDVFPTDQRWQAELKRSAPLILARLTALVGPQQITRLNVK